jgi:hypothetical protein
MLRTYLAHGQSDHSADCNSTGIIMMSITYISRQQRRIVKNIQIAAKWITCVAGYALIAVVLPSTRAEVRTLTELGARADTALVADRVAMTMRWIELSAGQ